jgi:hypothetical protein
MQVHFGRCLDVGPARIGVQEHDQLGALVELVGGGPLPHERLGVRHELGREIGLIVRRGTWHGIPPAAGAILVPTAPLSSLPITRRQPYSHL